MWLSGASEEFDRTTWQLSTVIGPSVICTKCVELDVFNIKFIRFWNRAAQIHGGKLLSNLTAVKGPSQNTKKSSCESDSILGSNAADSHFSSGAPV